MRGATVECKCQCGKMFTARVADRKRGWARSCSKSCAAIKSNRETGKYDRYLAGKCAGGSDGDAIFDDFDPSWDAHKDH